MKPIHLFILVCIAGMVGAILVMTTGVHWSCWIAIVLFIPGVALTLEVYIKEKREEKELLYGQLMKRENTINDFIQQFNMDRDRAERLYNNGYQNMDDFKDKTVKELMQIDEINPTLAKRIVHKMEEL